MSYRRRLFEMRYPGCDMARDVRPSFARQCSRAHSLPQLLVLWVFVVPMAFVANHQQVVIADDLDVGRIVDGIAHSRGKLISGVYKLNGTHTLSGAQGIEYEELYTVDSAFCFATDRFLIQQSGERDPEIPRRGGEAIREFFRMACLLPDVSYHYSSLNNLSGLHIYPPGTDRPRGHAKPIGVFDVRRVGIARSYVNIFNGESFENDLNHFENRVKGGGWTGAHLGNQRYRLTPASNKSWSAGERTAQYEFLVDAGRGFVVTKAALNAGIVADDGVELIAYEEFFQKHPVDESDLVAVKERELSSGQPYKVEIHWQDFADVFVPVRVIEQRVEPQFLQNNNGELELMTGWLKIEKVSLSFEWRSVNETLGDQYFSADRFLLPDDTRLFDHRERDRARHVGFLRDMRQSRASDVAESAPANAGQIAVLAFAFLCLAGVGIGLWMRSRRQA